MPLSVTAPAGARQKEITAYIEELQQSVSTASLNYDIWWMYKGRETRPKYIDVMNRYLMFFATSIHAHFVALIITLYRIYESKTDTFNVPQLLKKLRDGNDLPPHVLDALDALNDQAMPIWNKIKVLRNRAFGHRSKAHTPEQLFAEAKLKPDELAKIIEITKQLMNKLTLEWKDSTHAFNLNAADTLAQLLTDLQAVHARPVVK